MTELLAMESFSFSFRGGARIGLTYATWPFARLRVGSGHLTLSCFGNYEFQPADVVALEPVGSVPIFFSGIRIRHNRAEYPEKIIFWCLGNRDEVLDAINLGGFRAAGSPAVGFVPGPRKRSASLSALAAALPPLIALAGSLVFQAVKHVEQVDPSTALAAVHMHLPGSSNINPFAHPSTDADIAEGDRAYQGGDYRAAHERFEQVMQHGDRPARADAEKRLGYLSLYGLGVPKDWVAGVNYFKQAADLDDPYAKASLVDAYTRGYGVARDYDQALKWAVASSLQGVTWSMNAIGWAYRLGRGVPKDINNARLWYQKSADFGDPFGEANVAWLYLRGEGVVQDLPRAMSLYRQSAEQGCALGEGQLGWMYVHVEHDYAQGKLWYEKAAQQDDAAAQNNLGYLYENGLGVARDYAAAARWYEKSAAHGFVRALFHLGTLLVAGQGVPKDVERGHALIRRAADAGDGDAAAWLLKESSNRGTERKTVGLPLPSSA